MTVDNNFPGYLLDDTLPSEAQVVEQGMSLVESGDPLQVTIGATMQTHPKSWPLVLLRRISNPTYIPLLDKLIRKAESK